MPTVGWIQETALDRFYETGSDSDYQYVKPRYKCRICGKNFDSVSERDHHEIEHPVSNPAIYIDSQEVTGESVDITSPSTGNNIYLRNVDFLSVNGVDCLTESDFIERVAKESRAFLNVNFGNVNIDRTLKLRINIADPEELDLAGKSFIQCFEIAGLNTLSIGAFAEKVRSLQTIEAYSDGLERYLQGLMIKDNRSELYPFDVFIERFNQATSNLKNYKTSLSHAVSSVVNFNRNDFESIDSCGIPQLDSAVKFFRGGDLPYFTGGGVMQKLPVDYATEFILSSLLPAYRDGSLMDIESEINTFPPRYLSLQDKLKFKYICWRKSLQENDSDAQIRYQRDLRLDSVFSKVVGENHG